jgi:hypothetical protein
MGIVNISNKALADFLVHAKVTGYKRNIWSVL